MSAGVTTYSNSLGRSCCWIISRCISLVGFRCLFPVQPFSSPLFSFFLHFLIFAPTFRPSKLNNYSRFHLNNSTACFRPSSSSSNNNNNDNNSNNNGRQWRKRGPHTGASTKNIQTSTAHKKHHGRTCYKDLYRTLLHPPTTPPPPQPKPPRNTAPRRHCLLP